MYQHFLHWTEDGSHLVLGVLVEEVQYHQLRLDNEVWTFDIEHSQVRRAVDEDVMGYGFYADVSPDGSRIVYSACEPLYDSFYDIATVNMDGSGYRLLTENEYFENYPVWSPDGAEIAFIRSSWQYYRAGSVVGLYIMSAENGEVRRLYSTKRLALYPPAWSPDGQWLAFIAYEGECCPLERVLYTVRSDDSELTRIGETTAPAAWSPDGEELAFAAVEGEESVIYAVKADGTGQRTIWRSGPDDPSTPVSQVSWSPDGSELLFTSYHLYVIGSDGSGLRPLGHSGRAAWSPDGSRVAVYYVDHLLVTMARDGTDLRLLVVEDAEGRLRALDPSPSERPVNLAACSAGYIIREPEANPGLVHDCEVLLSIRDRLGGDVELNWSGSTPMRAWDGIFLGGSPSRVHDLILLTYDLVDTIPDKVTGTLPPELGGLTELRTLNLSGNYLTGSIPPELGSLMNLSYLNLAANYLTGSIPPELGSLMKLQWLNLRGNYLTGSIPPELGSLTELSRLFLDFNYLGGSIPPELGNLTNLWLSLSPNRFTGCIPTALRSIEGNDLRSLNLPNCEEAVSP